MDPDTVATRVALSTGVTLSYVAAGPSEARPVLLLHAWGETRRSFDRLLPALTDEVRAVAVDLRGHGGSDAPSTGYSLTELADDVVAFMDAVGLASAVLVGSSSGGYVAQQVAVTHPDRVTGLVLVGAPSDLRGRPFFADEVEALSDPVDAAWVRESLSWFPRFHAVPEWYVDDRVRDGAALPARVWGRRCAASTRRSLRPRPGRSPVPPSSCGETGTSCCPVTSRSSWWRVSPARGCSSTRTPATSSCGSSPHAWPPT